MTKTTNVDKIIVSFPSPASLNMTNMQEQINIVSAMSEELAAILVPAKQDGSTDDLRMIIRAELFKDFFPSIDYKKYQDLIDTELGMSAAKTKLKTQLDNPPTQDPYEGMGY